MPGIRIDLYSDTLTKPTRAMRQFMCEAEVGDEQKGEDPTVNLLQEMVAELLGKETALFLPSGTMCNQIAGLIHCRVGDEVLLDKAAHSLNYEGGGPSALAGTIATPLNGDRGVFTRDQVLMAVRPVSRHQPKTRLLMVEQTSNMGGGTVWPLETLREVCEAARSNNLRTHLDGARLLNATIASGIPPQSYTSLFDTVWIDLSKGLGAPVGAVIAGSNDLIQEAWQWKQRLGGAMRQAGIIAAAGVYALRHHVDRLAEDHANAKLLANGLACVRGITLDPSKVETNIVIFDVSTSGLTAQEVSDCLLNHGVRVSVVNRQKLLRAVTHLDISKEDIQAALQIIKLVLERTIVTSFG